MDDLSQQINQILSDPQSMKQIQDMMGALGLSGDPQPAGSQANSPQANNSQTGGAQTAGPQTGGPQTGGFDPSALAGVLSSLGGGTGGAPPQNAGASLGGLTPEMLQMVSRLAPLLGQVNRKDDSTRLLFALRPLLSPPRQKKLDEAVKILHMMRLLPLLKDSGMFSGLLSGLL